MSNEFKGLRYSSIALPMIPVGHPLYTWRDHADTDVQRTWRFYGWKPTREIAADARAKNSAPVARLLSVHNQS